MRYIFRFRNALLLTLNAFANVRLKPLQNLTIDHVKKSVTSGRTQQLLIIGKHKTGRICKINLPIEVGDYLTKFVQLMESKMTCSPDQKVQIFNIYYFS